MRFKDLPRAVQILIVLQTIVALVAVGFEWAFPPRGQWPLFGFLMLCAAVAGACKVDVNIRLGRITPAFTVACFTLLLLGIGPAMVVGVLGSLTGTVFNLKESKRRASLRKALSYQCLFNIGNCVLATFAMGEVFEALGGTPGDIRIWVVALPILAGALTYYVVNIGGVCLAIGWSQRISPLGVFKNHFAWTWPGFLASASIGAGLLWASQSIALVPVALLLFPVGYLIYSANQVRSDKVRADLEHMRELNRLNDAIIRSLAMAVDAKDRHTSQHVDRVQEYAVRLAGKLEVSQDEVQAIRIASLLHDIGKIGIPEHILCKPGKLTAEEFDVMKTHVEIGVAILEPVQFPWPVVPIVQTHHERWDGLGYPGGLRGEEIPIGGRIISLVDVYDALTSNRPYRRAIPREQALQIIRAARGTQFDPGVVDAFIELLPDVDSAIAALERDAATVLPTASLPAADGRSRSALAYGEQEDAAVLGIVGDLLAEDLPLAGWGPRLADRLEKLAPFSTFALFLTDPDQQHVTPVYAGGLWTQLLEGMEIRVGEGITGYTVGTGEPVVNGSAVLDLARRIRPGENLELNSTLSVPIRVQGSVVGALTLYHSGYAIYQSYHVRRISRLADLLGEAVSRGGLLRGEIPLSAVDSSTGLPSRHALLQFLHGRLTLAEATGQPLSVIMLGVGGNGDEPAKREPALRRMAAFLGETLRDQDYVARHGTTELAVALPQCGESQSAQILARLLERLYRDPVWNEESPAVRVGSSFFPADGGSGEALLRTALQRLVNESADPASPDIAVRR